MDKKIQNGPNRIFKKISVSKFFCIIAFLWEHKRFFEKGDSFVRNISPDSSAYAGSCFEKWRLRLEKWQTRKFWHSFLQVQRQATLIPAEAQLRMHGCCFQSGHTRLMNSIWNGISEGLICSLANISANVIGTHKYDSSKEPQ